MRKLFIYPCSLKRLPMTGYKYNIAVSQCSKQCSSILSSPKLVVVHFNDTTQVYCNDFVIFFMI